MREGVDALPEPRGLASRCGDRGAQFFGVRVRPAAVDSDLTARLRESSAIFLVSANPRFKALTSERTSDICAR